MTELQKFELGINVESFTREDVISAIKQRFSPNFKVSFSASPQVAREEKLPVDLYSGNMALVTDAYHNRTLWKLNFDENQHGVRHVYLNKTRNL